MHERWQRLRLRIPPWLEDPLVLFLVEQGIPGLQVEEMKGAKVLIVYLPEEASVDGLKEKVQSYYRALEEVHGVPFDFDWQVTPLVDEDWQEAWKRHFRPTRISPRFVARPSWESYDPPEGTVVLQIDPGQAFGTGLHATTRMCLMWIDKTMDSRKHTPPETALDVGTGTGILAIALAKMGVGTVWALDTDSLATEAARMNVRINGVEDRVVVLEGSLNIVKDHGFPMAVANLTGPLLKEMASGFAECVVSGGWLLLSGVLFEEQEAVLETYTRAGFVSSGKMEEEMWCALLFKRRA